MIAKSSLTYKKNQFGDIISYEIDFLTARKSGVSCVAFLNVEGDRMERVYHGAESGCKKFIRDRRYLPKGTRIQYEDVKEMNPFLGFKKFIN